MDKVELTFSNFYQFAFNPKSPKLSSKDQIIASIATVALGLSFGIGHWICHSMNKKDEKKYHALLLTGKSDIIVGKPLYPMPANNKFLPLSLKFSKTEFEMVKKGFTPQDMDDRWIIFSEEDHVYFHRSWTGNMIFDCLFEEKGDEVEIPGVYVNQNSEQYSETSDEQNIETFKGLLKFLGCKL